MARRYSVSGSQNAAAATTILGITSAATIRPAVYDFVMGSAAAPADQANNVQLKRYTAAGTATSVTPQALDSGDPAALAGAGENHTVEPTYTAGATMLSLSFNQQATVRWIVPPDDAIILPATAANGLGAQFVIATATALHEASMFYVE